jgi:ABC-type hemin transport system substrate-binding protein
MLSYGSCRTIAFATVVQEFARRIASIGCDVSRILLAMGEPQRALANSTPLLADNRHLFVHDLLHLGPK